jgi:hypothetical protein
LNVHTHISCAQELQENADAIAAKLKAQTAEYQKSMESWVAIQAAMQQLEAIADKSKHDISEREGSNIDDQEAQNNTAAERCVLNRLS